MPIADWQARALRLGISVSLCLAVGCWILNDTVHWHDKDRSAQVAKGAKWAAITCVIVTLPVIGKVVKSGTERMIGTAAGGAFGLLFYTIADQFDVADQSLCVTLGGGLAAAASTFLSFRFGLESSAKLFAVTFVLVCFGAHTQDSAVLVAATRVGGICAGVLITLVLSVLVYPRSATVQMLGHLRTAAFTLCEMNSITWRQLGAGPGGGDGLRSPTAAASAGRSLLSPLLSPSEGGGPANDEKEVERLLLKLWNALSAAEAEVEVAAQEVYIGNLGGTWCFLPGLYGCEIGRYRVPRAEIADLAGRLRQVAWIVSTLFQNLEGGFDEVLCAHVASNYPEHLLHELRASALGAVREVHDAFPIHPVDTGRLGLLRDACDLLQQSSSAQRRRELHPERFRSFTDRPKYRPPAALPISALERRGLSILATGKTQSLGRHELTPSQRWAVAAASSVGAAEAAGRAESPLQHAATTTGHGLTESSRSAPPEEESEELHLAQVRWYSFQFLIQEFLSSVEDVTASMDNLREKLPHAPVLL